MESYIKEHAELYDHLYRDKDYQSEVDFIDTQFSKYGDVKNILELACGTGNHSFLLEKKGYHLFCTDASAGMVERANSKKNASSSSINFEKQDMRTLPELDVKYDAALCLFDSIGYAITNEDTASTFAGIANNLKDGGLLIFEYWHAAAMLRHFDPLRVKEVATDTCNIIRVSNTEIDFPSQVATVHYTIHQHFNDNMYHTFTEDLRCRFFLMQEMNLFLSQSGFKFLNAYNGYKPDESIDDNTWHIVCVAQKESK